MKYCYNCGTQMENGTHYCLHCGCDNGCETGGTTSTGTKKSSGTAVQKMLIAGVATLIVVLVAGFGVWSAFGRNSDDTVVEVQTDTAEKQEAAEAAAVTMSASKETSKTSLSASEVCDKTKESNVGILIVDEEGETISEGSGIIWKESSGKTYIITCAHVVDYTGFSVLVQTSDGTQYKASVTGYDISTDIGLVSINKTGLKTVDIGDSDALKVGDPVYAVGNPDGVEFFGTFTTGHVTAKDRSFLSANAYAFEMNHIQHDATINPGNSGGMLVNQYGEVVGVNSSKWVKTGYEGMDFAIPINEAMEVAGKLMQYGYVPGRPKLGASTLALYEAIYYTDSAVLFNLMIEDCIPEGSRVIIGVDADSSLANEDINYMDLITEINGEELEYDYTMFRILNNSKVGDTLRLTVLRVYSEDHIEEMTVTATLVQDKGATEIIDLPYTEEDDYYDDWYDYGYDDDYDYYYDDYDYDYDYDDEYDYDYEDIFSWLYE